MHCDEHFGQEGDKLGVSSTKSVVEIWPQRTSSREENTFFVLLIDGMVFLLQDTDLIFHSFQQPPLFQVMAAATDSVDSRKYFLVKNQSENQAFRVPLFAQILLLLLHAHSCNAGDHRKSKR